MRGFAGSRKACGKFIGRRGNAIRFDSGGRVQVVAGHLHAFKDAETVRGRFGSQREGMQTGRLGTEGFVT